MCPAFFHWWNMQTETVQRSKYIALALPRCQNCQGTGLDDQGTCPCVWRKVFRIVLKKVRDIAIGAHLMRPISLTAASSPRGRTVNRHKLSDYSSDVYLTAKRTLTDPIEWGLFQYHYLLGADWNACCRELGMDRGNFFHACYRIEAKLGEIFATLQPYALFPCDSYFSTGYARVQPIPVPDAPHPNGLPLRPPLAPAAPAPYPLDAIKAEVCAAFSRGETLQAIASDLNARRIRPQRARFWTPSIVYGITGPRRVLGPRKPIHLVQFDISDEAAVGQACRKWYSAGKSFATICANLKRLGVPTACPSMVRDLLISHPGMPKAKAA